MKKLLASLLVIASTLLAYEVEIEGVGTVEIPDNVCDTVFAEEFVEEFEDYNHKNIVDNFFEDLNGAPYSMTGNDVVALLNFYSATNFKSRFFIKYYGKSALGWFNTASTDVHINSKTMPLMSREMVLYVLLHEITHSIQLEEGEIKNGTPVETIVNEIFADYNAIYSVSYLTGLSLTNSVRFRQSAKTLSGYASSRARVTAEVLIEAIILEQNYKLTR